MSKTAETSVRRIYMGFGYFFEWHTCIDGEYAAKNIAEIWVGKENIGFKNFCFAASLDELAEDDIYYIISTQFTSLIQDYQERFSEAISDYEELVTTPVNERGLATSELEYTLTRIYLDEYNYYEYTDIEPLEGFIATLDFWVGRVGTGLKVAADIEQEFFSEFKENEAEEISYELLGELEEVYNMIDDCFDVIAKEVEDLREGSEELSCSIYASLGTHINHDRKVLDSDDEEEDLFEL